MMQKYLSILLSVALIIGICRAIPAKAQDNLEAQIMAEPFANLSSALKIPVQFFFYMIYIIGEFPVWILRGFSALWQSWGFPPFSAIIFSFSVVAPAVFRDSLLILLFFAFLEGILLPVVIPLLGLLLIFPAWVITALVVCIFAVVDFVAKVGDITSESSKARGGGWW